MKEKIENLIKEVGINEVDSTLQEIKSKDNVKENIKKDFIELLSGCNISIDDDGIDYKKDGNLLFFYQKNENIFWIGYSIWLNFESKNNLNYHELRDLLISIVEEVLNYKDVTPYMSPAACRCSVEEVLNYKDVTPIEVFGRKYTLVEEVLNYKDVTPQKGVFAFKFAVEEVLNY